MDSPIAILSILTLIAVAAGICFWLGRRIQKGSQAEDVAKAQKKMASVADRDLPYTARRLRDSRF